jgi:hypothetical protein
MNLLRPKLTEMAKLNDEPSISRLHQPEAKVRRLQIRVEGRMAAFISPKI